MDDNFIDRKLDEKWLDIGSIFEGVTNQTNDIQNLNSVGSNLEVSSGYTGDLSSANVKDLIEESEINAWQKIQDTQIKNDLASVFQDELELKDVSSGLNEWMITPVVISEQDTSNFEVPEQVITEEVFKIITFSL